MRPRSIRCWGDCPSLLAAEIEGLSYDKVGEFLTYLAGAFAKRASIVAEGTYADALNATAGLLALAGDTAIETEKERLLLEETEE